MELTPRKLRLIQFISELEDETFFDFIESVIESSGERFGLHLPEIELNQTETQEKQPQSEGEKLLADFYAKMENYKDKATRKRIVFEKYTSEECLKIALMIRLEEAEKHPETMIDSNTFFANLKERQREKSL